MSVVESDVVGTGGGLFGLFGSVVRFEDSLVAFAESESKSSSCKGAAALVVTADLGRPSVAPETLFCRLCLRPSMKSL
jgi:hypothetical protein